MLGAHLLKSWGSTQPSISFSSGEAEFHAAIKGAAEGIGIQSLLKDMGISVTINIHTDTSAAKGTAARIGIGKVKHLDVAWLWIQDAVRRGLVKILKIDGKTNPADLMTKPKSAAEAVRLMGIVGYGLVMREAKKGRPVNFTAFVNHLMKGSVESEEDQRCTRDWWQENLRWKW